jgi:peptide/nickel transport system substrate-binding protein
VRFRPLLATLLLLLCVACGGKETPQKAPTAAAAAIGDTTPQDGGTLNRRFDVDVVTLNPLISTNRYDRMVAQYLFTPIVNIDRNLQPIAGLAESWKIADDGLLYTFELNPKATFTDGTPVRASDVIFTLARIKDPASEAVQIAGNFQFLDLARTRAVDDHTVEVAFTQPLAAQLLSFNDVLIIPEHVYGKGDFRKDFNSMAVGSGPYRLVRHVPGKEVVVERRADYWGERPHIQTVVIKMIGDHGVAFNALRRGDIDETMIASDTWVREQNNPELTKTIAFQRFYTNNYNFVAWSNRHPILGDKRVRRALAMCIPVEPIVNDLYHGTARAMSGPFTPDSWAFNPTVPVIRHDIEAAKQLLATAGWTDSNADGVVDRNGKKFQISIISIAGSATGAQVVQMIQSELKKAGVQVDIQSMDGASAIQRILSGNFDSAYLSWDLDPDPDQYIAFHSSQVPPRGQNFVFYSNPVTDRLIEQARREIDQSKRKELYWKIHEVLADDQPYTWIVQVSAKWGMNKRVHGAVPSRGMGYFLWYPGEFDWWIAPGR